MFMRADGSSKRSVERGQIRDGDARKQEREKSVGELTEVFKRRLGVTENERSWILLTAAMDVGLFWGRPRSLHVNLGVASCAEPFPTIPQAGPNWHQIS